MCHDRTGNPIQPDGMDMTVTENGEIQLDNHFIFAQSKARIWLC